MTKLVPFQLKNCKRIYTMRGRALLADEQGLGKTIQALYWIRKLPNRRPAIIVTPSSVKYQWQAEASLHFDMRLEVIEGNRPARLMQLPGKIVIINYDILASWLPVLLKHQPQVVIFDEVHFIKNPRAQRTKAAIKLAKRAASVVGLSGTPLTKEAIELWSVLQAIKPRLFPERWTFAWRYTRPFQFRGNWLFRGSRNTEELHSILKKKVMIRNLKKDVLPELPDKQRIIVPVHIDDLSEYQKAELDFMQWLKKISPARAKRAAKVEALAKVGYLLRLVAELKLPLSQHWIAEFLESNPEDKLVVFSMHTKVVQTIASAFSKICVVVDGKVKGVDRQAAVRKFQSNARTRLFIGQYRASAFGLNLTAASTICGLDLPWTAGAMAQGDDRIHRIGQTSKTFMHYLIAQHTLEERFLKGIKSSQKKVSSILDGTPSGRSKQDSFAQLIDSYA